MLSLLGVPLGAALADLMGWLNGPLTVGLLSSFGYFEMMLLGVIALMLFGSRLPEVARNFGQTYKQLRGKVDEFQREFRNWDQDVTPSKPKFTPEDEVERVQPKTPKFQPPPEDDD